MSRRLIGCFCMPLLFAAVSWAADPFLGTWTADMAKFRQQVKDLPPGAIGDTFKVEAYKSGYKITHTVGGKFAYVTTVDFLAGVTPVRDAEGEEIDRIKVVGKSVTEIETTSWKQASPSTTGYFREGLRSKSRSSTAKTANPR